MSQYDPCLPATVEEIVAQQHSMLLLIPSQHMKKLLQRNFIVNKDWRLVDRNTYTYIRGGPNVTGSREGDCIREVGNKRDIVCQMLLKEKGDQNSTHTHTLCVYMYRYISHTIICCVLLASGAGASSTGGFWAFTNRETNTWRPLMSSAVAYRQQKRREKSSNTTREGFWWSGSGLQCNFWWENCLWVSSTRYWLAATCEGPHGSQTTHKHVA